MNAQNELPPVSAVANRLGRGTFRRGPRWGAATCRNFKHERKFAACFPYRVGEVPGVFDAIEELCDAALSKAPFRRLTVETAVAAREARNGTENHV
jgi:hypothetical protein